MPDLGVPGVRRLPVRIPIPALREVNVYALDLADGTLGLVDTGWDDEESWASLVEGLAAIGRAPEDVSRIAVTHAHPDHLGLARRLREVGGAEVFLHEEEARRLGRGAPGPRRYARAAREAYPRWGVGPAEIEQLLGERAGLLARAWDVEVTPVSDGEVLPFPGWRLSAVWTPGHSPGHLCLLDLESRALFTGDHVLPRITPGVGVHPEDDSDPLAAFLGSLERVAELDVGRVLPGHEEPFDGLAERVHDLVEHHRRRLDEVVACVAVGDRPTAWQVAHRLTWSRPLADIAPAGRRLALSETQAHLVHLRHRQELHCTHDPDAPLERWSVVGG